MNLSRAIINPLKKKYCLSLLFCTILYPAHMVLAQTKRSGALHNASVSAQLYYGSFLTIAPKAQYLRDSYTRFDELAFYKQTDGSQPWQIANHMPDVGFAVLFGNTGSKQYIGHMAGAFPFINFHLYTGNIWASQLRLGSGAVWIEKPYDPVTNHKNVLIGSRFNYFLNFLWLNQIRLSSHISLTAALSFNHISNGTMQLPNLGLNIPAISLGTTYHFDQKLPVKKATIPAYDRHTQYSLYTSAGLKQTPWVGSPHYIVNVLNAEATKHFSFSNKYGAGAVLFYDRSLLLDDTGLAMTKEGDKKIQGGIYGLYEHQFGKMSVPVQLGFYVYHPYQSNFSFQSVGLRYQLSPHWQYGVYLKTHLGKADYIHTGIGYTF